MTGTRTLLNNAIYDRQQRRCVCGETSSGPSPAGVSTAPLKLLLTPQEAANALGINRSTLYELLMAGDIPSIKIGRARRIAIAALERWIAEQTDI